MKSLKILCFFLLLSFAPCKAESTAIKHVLLINDTSNWYHWGCTGTSTALKSGIEAYGYQTTTFPISSVYELKHIPKSLVDFDNPEFFDAFCKANPLVMNLMYSVDILIINGEGTLHRGIEGVTLNQKRNGPLTLLYLAYIGKTVLEKHVEIINHSCFPHDNQTIDDCETCSLYQRVYQSLDFIAIREILSFQALEKLGVQATLSFDCLPLYIRDQYTHTKSPDEKIFLLSGSVAWEKEGMVQIIDFLKEKRNEGYHIQVLVGAQDYPARDDRLLVQFLKQSLDGDWELIIAKDLDEWLKTIHQASCLISGRFHHTIAALCLGTPCITLNSNTSKIDALMLMANQPPPLSYKDSNLYQKLQACRPSPPEPDWLKRFCLLSEKNFEGLQNLSYTTPSLKSIQFNKTPSS